MKKQRVQKTGKTEQNKVPGEWLYLAKESVTIRQIEQAIGETYEKELWEEAGVLEVAFAEASSMDFEHVKIHPKDELTRDYVAKEGCSEVFLVTFVPEEFGRAKEVMNWIIKACGGMFCGDTEDFLPVERGESDTFAK